jgi:murein DD-endopeptidase MepM/ murein hydrolase activator NlpD
MRPAAAVALIAWLSACSADDENPAGSAGNGGHPGSGGSAGDVTASGASAGVFAGGGGAPQDAGMDGAIDAGEIVLWPISTSPAPDADPIRAQYGPRNIGNYDFHAGIDIAAPKGTPVHSVLAGTVVNVVVWDGSATAGNSVLVEHSGARFTAYLHLDSIAVESGELLAAGDLVGTVGDTGATYDHLHLTYMVGLQTPKNDERKSRNPLELLPHTGLPPATVSFGGATLEVLLAVQQMTVERLTLENGSASRSVSYYDVVALGSVARDDHVQNGVYLDAGKAVAGTFPLLLAVDPPDFVPTRLVLHDFSGAVVLDASP